MIPSLFSLSSFIRGDNRGVRDRIPVRFEGRDGILQGQ